MVKIPNEYRETILAMHIDYVYYVNIHDYLIIKHLPPVFCFILEREL